MRDWKRLKNGDLGLTWKGRLKSWLVRQVRRLIGDVPPPFPPDDITEGTPHIRRNFVTDRKSDS